MKERYESVNKLPRKNVNRAVSLCPNSQRNAFKAQQISGRVGGMKNSRKKVELIYIIKYVNFTCLHIMLNRQLFLPIIHSIFLSSMFPRESLIVEQESCAQCVRI